MEILDLVVGLETDLSTFWFFLFTGRLVFLDLVFVVVLETVVVLAVVLVEAVVGLGVVIGTRLSTSTFSVTRIGFLTIDPWFSELDPDLSLLGAKF